MSDNPPGPVSIDRGEAIAGASMFNPVFSSQGKLLGKFVVHVPTRHWSITFPVLRKVAVASARVDPEEHDPTRCLFDDVTASRTRVRFETRPGQICTYDAWETKDDPSRLERSVFKPWAPREAEEG